MATTVDLTTWPTAREDASEDKWRKMMANFYTNGVWRGRLNEFEPYADSTGMHIKVKSGQCWIEGEQGEKTTETTLDIGAAHATLGRLDYIVLRLDTTTVVDTVTAATISLRITPGTASATPVLPALSATATVIDVPVGLVYVGPAVTTITAPNCESLRAFAHVTNAGEWVDFTPVVQAVGGGAGPALQADASNRARYMLSGTTVRVSFNWKVALSGTAGAEYGVRVPHPGFYFGASATPSSGQCGGAFVQNSSGIARQVYSGTFSYGVIALRRGDNANLPNDGVGRIDAFDITYEIL